MSASILHDDRTDSGALDDIGLERCSAMKVRCSSIADIIRYLDLHIMLSSVDQMVSTLDHDTCISSNIIEMATAVILYSLNGKLN